MEWILAEYVTYAVAIFIVVSVVVVLSMRKFRDSDVLMTVRVEGADFLAERLEFVYVDQWASEHGFVPELLADFDGVIGGSALGIAVWRNYEEETFLASYAKDDGIASEFVTMFERNIGITTSNSRDSAFFPPMQGQYVQVFDDLDLDSLYTEHIDGLTFLQSRKLLNVTRRRESTAELMLESVRRQTAYIRSIPLWQIRGVYWYFVRRNLMNNRRLSTQYARANP